jgi:UDP-2,3-diacylglucosamine pyrophosphatase LpxH
MLDNNSLLSELEQMLKWKKSKLFYAQKLNITITEVEELLKELQKPKEETYLYQVKTSTTPTYVSVNTSDVRITEEENNHITGDKKITLESSHPLSPKEIEELAGVDNITTFVDRSWLKSHKNGTWTYSILTVCKSIEKNPIKFQAEFVDFLKGFTPSPIVIKNCYLVSKPKISLILPKQDAHYNKYDIYGNNSIESRFSKEQLSILNMVTKASATNYIDEVVYIVGSDQFNSEWTNLTTKGTPQENILSYQGAFTAICNHEVEIITTLLHYSNKVKIIFIPGNHDEFVGWHLINWLETYYRNNTDLTFNSSTENTKYHQYGNSAIMFNHGDAIKPKELAHKFPIGFKDRWSSCDNYYIFTGDKHVELSLDIHRIKFYQVPQLSNAKSKWDDKQGYIDSKAEMTAFVLTEEKGMSDIYKELI